MHSFEGVQLDLHFAYSRSTELNCLNTYLHKKNNNMFQMNYKKFVC